MWSRLMLIPSFIKLQSDSSYLMKEKLNIEGIELSFNSETEDVQRYNLNKRKIN